MPARARRAARFAQPKSRGAIRRSAKPKRGENRGPGKDVIESLTRDPELESSLGHDLPSAGVERTSDRLPITDVSVQRGTRGMWATNRLMRRNKVRVPYGR